MITGSFIFLLYSLILWEMLFHPDTIFLIIIIYFWFANPSTRWTRPLEIILFPMPGKKLWSCFRGSTAAKTSPKKWICAVSNSISLSPTPLICQMLAIFRGWILKDLSSQKQKGNCCLVFTSSIKREIRQFHVVVVQWLQRKCTKKHDACAKLLFWQP